MTRNIRKGQKEIREDGKEANERRINQEREGQRQKQLRKKKKLNKKIWE